MCSVRVSYGDEINKIISNIMCAVSRDYREGFGKGERRVASVVAG